MQYSIVTFSEITRNSDFRVDAEYYKKEILDRLNVLERRNKDILDNLVEFVVGPFGSTITTDKYVGKSDYRYVRNKDISDFFIKGDAPALLPREVYDSLSQFHIQENDLLITVVGTLGKVAIATHKDTKSIFSCKSTIIRAKKINSFYLLTYLNSDTGKLFSLRGKRGVIQEGLNLTDLKEIQVFIPSNSFQLTIERVIKRSFVGIDKSKALFTQAQTLLLSELGLINWQPQHRLTFVKNYSDTEQAGRIDADYFQPKYEEIDKVLIKLNGKPIGSYEFLDITTGHYCPNYVSSNEGRPYLRGTDLAVGSVAMENLFYIRPKDQIQSKQAQEGDVVVTRVGTIGLSARIPEECDGGTISDNLIRVRILDKQKIDSYYLSCFLGSKIGKSLMLRNARGSVQQRLNQETFKEIMLPIPEMEVQSKIKHKIIESFNLRKQSKHLLECAKRAVEIAVEQDEQTAIDYLENETQEVTG